jgi:hypothetical protein
MANDKKEMKKVLKRMQKRNAKEYSKLCKSECTSSENTAPCVSVDVEPPKVDLDYLIKFLGSLNEQQTRFFEANKDILKLTSLTHGVERYGMRVYKEVEMYYASLGLNVTVKMNNLE